MSRGRGIFVVIWILGACATLALAQAPGWPPTGGRSGPGGQGAERQRHPMSPLIEALDANGDGIIDADEIANAPAALRKLDRNGDGRLTPDEYLPRRPGGQGATGGPSWQAPGQGGFEMGVPGMGTRGRGGEHQHPISPIVAALDANGDGVIDADEIAAASTALVKLDRNGDGKLTPDEYLPPRPGGQGPSGRFNNGTGGQGGRGGPGGQSGMGASPAGGYGQGSPPPQTEGSYAGTSSGAIPKQITIGAPSTPEPAQATAGDAEVLAVTGVASLSNPLRLMVSGQGFQEGCKVEVGDRPVPNTIFRGEHMAIAEGAGLEQLLPRGGTVMITVVTPDGRSSAPIAFTR